MKPRIVSSLSLTLKVWRKVKEALEEKYGHKLEPGHQIRWDELAEAIRKARGKSITTIATWSVNFKEWGILKLLKPGLYEYVGEPEPS